MKYILFAVLVLCSGFNAFSATRTWDGGGADANWQTPANWIGDAAPAANDDLIFPAAATQFSTNNNFFFLTNFNSISVEGGTYTFGGNAIRLSNGLTIGSGTQTFNLAITSNGSQTFSAAQGAQATIVILSVGSFPLTIDGAGVVGIGFISGNGAITKNGSGIGAIVAASGFSGPIMLNNGIFVVDANIPSSNVTINSPTTSGGILGLSGLGGTGTVGSVNVQSGVVSSGTLSSPTGILNISNGLTFTSSGAYVCKIAGTTPGANGHDQLNVTGPVNLNHARLGPLPWNAFRPVIGNQFVIIRNDGTDPINGTFLNAPEGSIFAGPLNTAFRITYIGGDGNDVVITSVPRAAFDLDGDGRSDVSTFRPSNGTWNAILSANGSTFSQQFGVSNDLITPADFDGDNRTDIAVFRPSNGFWYILNSSTSTISYTSFGSSGDIPLPNDFDGDGRSDIAVFRRSSGVWYKLQSLTGQVYIQQFGQDGDIPQLMDFDGDGIGDLAVFRPADGTWHFWQSSTSSYAAFPFGIATDKPVPADYNGDGKTDVAVFRATDDPTQPDFYILLTSPFTYYGISWGVNGDIPAVADYDGDGKADVAIYRPSTNDWYLLRSTAGFGTANFGQAGDRPLPSAFVP